MLLSQNPTVVSLLLQEAQIAILAGSHEFSKYVLSVCLIFFFVLFLSESIFLFPWLFSLLLAYLSSSFISHLPSHHLLITFVNVHLCECVCVGHKVKEWMSYYNGPCQRPSCLVLCFPPPLSPWPPLRKRTKSWRSGEKGSLSRRCSQAPEGEDVNATPSFGCGLASRP